MKDDSDYCATDDHVEICTFQLQYGMAVVREMSDELGDLVHGAYPQDVDDIGVVVQEAAMAAAEEEVLWRHQKNKR